MIEMRSTSGGLVEMFSVMTRSGVVTGTAMPWGWASALRSWEVDEG